MALLRPLRWLVPMGWMGVRYTTSKPSLAISGRRRSASEKVALRSGTVPWERGNISYHAPKRARSRSTTTSSVSPYTVDVERSGCSLINSLTSSERNSATLPS